MRDRSSQTYVGIYNDMHGGMTPIGMIIKDAWVFGLIPETETCEGWKLPDIQTLYDKVSAAWEPYGHLVSRLPRELREKHKRIHDAAIKRARDAGWVPGLDMDSEMDGSFE